MSDLSNDLSHWPTDPFLLLGVDRTVNERELKRAYVRLIKRFKPEHFPRHFRRLRDAFEEVHGQIASLDSRHGDTEETQNDVSVASSDQPPSWEMSKQHPQEEGQGVVAGQASAITPISAHNQFDADWELACTGQLPAAYERMRPTAIRESAGEDVFLGLYWILTMTPTIEPERQPIDWLYEGLRRHGFKGRLAALYRNKLKRYPQEGSAQQGTDLLRALQEPADIVELLYIRWLAFDQLRSQSINSAKQFVVDIVNDYAIAEQLLRHEHEDHTAVVQFMTIDFLIWEDEPTAVEFVKNLILQLNAAHHVHTSQGWRFDRYDRLLIAVNHWRRLRARRKPPWSTMLATLLLEFIRYAAIARYTDGSSLIGRCQSEIASDPHLAMSTIDALGADSSGLCRILISELEAAEYSVDSNEEEEELDRPGLIEYLRNFVVESPWYRYDRFRRLLLDFCIQECVSPQAVAKAVSEIRELVIADGRQLCEAIAADSVLNIVYGSTRSHVEPRLALGIQPAA